LSGNNKSILFIILAALILSSCSSGAGGLTEEARMEAAVQEGIIARVFEMEAREADYNLAEAVIGDIVRFLDVRVSLDTPTIQDLYFERDGGRLVGVYVNNYQWVQKGELLAEIEFDKEELLSEREKLMIEVNRFESGFEAEEARQLLEIDWLGSDFEFGMSDAEMEIRALSLMKAELSYNRFLNENERVREDYNKKISEIDEKLEGEKLLAPFDGIVYNVMSFSRYGNVIRNWTRMLSIMDNTRLQFRAQNTIDLLRYGDTFTAEISADETQFEMRVVSDPIATDTREGSYTFIMQPTDPADFWRQLMSLELSFQEMQQRTVVCYPMAYEARNVVILPRIAISAEDGRSYVWIYDEGQLKKRYVVTGLTHDGMTQVVSGVEPGQLVVLDIR